MSTEISLEELMRRLEKLGADVPRAAREAIVETGMALQGKFVQEATASTLPHPPADRGEYGGSWRGRPTADGYEVYNLAKHAKWIERGRAPGGSPGALYPILKAWARRKGLRPGIAWALAVRMSHEGYRPRWVLRRASEQVRPFLRRAVRARLDRLLRLG